MGEELNIAKKKLLYRSLNRGCKETDLLLGKFARVYLSGLNAAETSLYEKFLDEYDGDIYNWLCGKSAWPEEYSSISKKLAASCAV